jgi:tetratricopeptide (TPR) repeat protein
MKENILSRLLLACGLLLLPNPRLEAQNPLRAAEEHFRSGQFQQAEAAYRLAAGLHPKEATIGIARCQIELGKVREAFEALDAVLKSHPNDPDATRAIAHVFVEVNQFFRAETLLKRLVAADQQDRESWYYLGLLLYRNGYYQAALNALDRSKGDPAATPMRRTRTRVYRAVCLDRIGRQGEAEAAFVALGKLTETRTDLDLLLVHAELLYETGRLEQALERAESAIRAHPDAGLAHFWQGRVLLSLGRLSQAAGAGEKAVGLLPQLPYAHNLLLRIYQRQGRVQEAAREARWLREFEDRRTGPR